MCFFPACIHRLGVNYHLLGAVKKYRQLLVWPAIVHSAVAEAALVGRPVLPSSGEKDSSPLGCNITP